jgi:CMP-N-acetylneuraminic acid synthetase
MSKNIEDVAIVIQARLGSQRVPQKMIKPFAGTTLIDIFLDKIKQCKSFPLSNFYLSAYEKEIKEIAQRHSVNVFHRSEKSAKSEGTPMTEMYEWHDKLPHKYVILINACVPFMKSETIDAFVNEYVATDENGMFAVINKKNYFWDSNGVILTPLTEDVMNTKTMSPTSEAAHCLYASRLDTIQDGIWMGDFNKPGQIKLFPIAEEETLDIDYPWQFNMCEALWRNNEV